jgi:hypothetical protein
MAQAETNDNWLTRDPELRESIRVIRRDRSWRLIGVAVALVGAVGVAFGTAYLSYNDTFVDPPASAPR